MALVTLHVMSEHWKYLSAVQSKGSCGIEDGDVIGGGLGHEDLLRGVHLNARAVVALHIDLVGKTRSLRITTSTQADGSAVPGNQPLVCGVALNDVCAGDEGMPSILLVIEGSKEHIQKAHVLNLAEHADVLPHHFVHAHVPTYNAALRASGQENGGIGRVRTQTRNVPAV